jgi:glycolate oxidase
VLNLDLTRQVTAHGLHFAPDPSSQQSCSIGGNVANNSGGPHCLSDGVTAAHILAMEVVLSDGASCTSVASEARARRSRPARRVRGQRGHVRHRHQGVRAAHAERARGAHDADGLRDGGGRCPDGERDHRRGMVPAALEMMDQLCVQAVEAYIHAGLPVEAAAVLLVEVAGLPHGLEADVARIVEIGMAHGAGTVRIAQDEAERALLWKGRKTAFGAIARIKPNYYLHDTVVPRRMLPEVLREVYAICRTPRASGDERVPRRRRQPAPAAGVRQARARCDGACARGRRGDRACLGGGRGSAQRRTRHRAGEARLHAADVRPGRPRRAGSHARAFDPTGLANPFKVLPSPARAAMCSTCPEGAWV